MAASGRSDGILTGGFSGGFADIFSSDLFGRTITLTGGELVLDRDVTIRGRVTISGDGASRVLSVQPGVTAVLENLKLRDGLADNGGALHNEGQLTLLGDAEILVSSATSQGRRRNVGPERVPCT